MNKVISRRSLIDMSLRSVAGAGLLASMPGSGLLTPFGHGVLASAGRRRRALVCIYGFGGGDDRVLTAPHRLHKSLSDLQPLYDQKILAVIGDVTRPARMQSFDGTPGEVMAKKYSALRFLPEGFVTLEWAARAANVDEFTGDGAYRFNSGVSLVARGATPEGASFENAAIRRLTESLPPLRTSFPSSEMGRKLEDVSRLLRVAPALGMADQVFVVPTMSRSRDAADATLDARRRDLAQAMAAFYAATVELGLQSDVTTYTDGEFTERSHDTGARMVLGGSVVSGNTSTPSQVSQDSYAGAMASWLGVSAREVRARFPEFVPSAVVVTA